MAKVEVRVEDGKPQEERNPLLSMARRVLMASIGAVALTQDEMEKFVGKLVERGEIAEKDGRKLVQDVVDRRRSQTIKVEEQMDRRVGDILARMNVPTKADIEALEAKIVSLSRKIDELKR
ncbi:MAG TPA: phasin family protein [Anaerolineae bacterium]|nr:phasin family protein [Anaerolineae bacterium]